MANWYDGWVGEGGSDFHKELAVPLVLDLLEPQSGERILDVGAGQGALAPAVSARGAIYTGVDASPRMVKLARARHGSEGCFFVGDARHLQQVPGLTAGGADAVVFMLSIQDMDPLEAVILSAAWALRSGGRIVLLLTHPAFRVPRQSGWGWDGERKLHYRRVDRYLTPLPVPMKALRHGEAPTRSFHRPVGAYVNCLAESGLFVDRMLEIPGYKPIAGGAVTKAGEAARLEIPLLLGIRARKQRV